MSVFQTANLIVSGKHNCFFALGLCGQSLQSLKIWSEEALRYEILGSDRKSDDNISYKIEELKYNS